MICLVFRTSAWRCIRRPERAEAQHSVNMWGTDRISAGYIACVFQESLGGRRAQSGTAIAGLLPRHRRLRHGHNLHSQADSPRNPLLSALLPTQNQMNFFWKRLNIFHEKASAEQLWGQHIRQPPPARHSENQSASGSATPRNHCARE